MGENIILKPGTLSHIQKGLSKVSINITGILKLQSWDRKDNV